MKTTKLQEMRKNRGLSQERLALVSGVELRTIRAYEDRTRRIDGATIEKLCRLAIALDCKVQDLIEDDKLVKLIDATKK